MEYRGGHALSSNAVVLRRNDVHGLSNVLIRLGSAVKSDALAECSFE